MKFLPPFIIAILLVAATMAFAGCTEKEAITPIIPDIPGHEDPPAEEQVENILDGTSWTCHMENSTRMQGIPVNITYDAFLDFNDSVNGELFHDFYMEIPGYPQYSQSENYTEPFTYTYYGDSCVLSLSYFDAEENDTVHYSYSLTYDKDANTLTLKMNNADMSAMMGTDIMVFTPLSIPAKNPRTQSREQFHPRWGNIPDMAALTVILESLAR